MTILEKVKNTIERYSMLERGETVLVAVSGGVDSVVLLDLLTRLKDELSPKLAVCHMNHGLRGEESAGDMRFVEELARGLGLGFEGRTLNEGELKKDAPGGLQERAREARYAFFEEAAKKYGATKVVLGHNRDDQAETVLMRMMKGSGLRGLSGIPPVRDKFIRPLIEIKRAEIERYANERGIVYRTDRTNESCEYLRNDLRLRLIPFIEKEFCAGVKDMLVETAAKATLAQNFIEKEAEKLFSTLALESGRSRVVLDRLKLIDAPDVLSSEVFFKAVGLLKGNLRDIYSCHVEAFLGLAKSDRPNAEIDLPQGIKILREYDRIIVTSGGVVEAGAQKVVETELFVPGITTLEGLGVEIEASVLDSAPSLDERDERVAYFDLDLLNLPLTVRSFEEGDRLTPFGMTGTKKLKDLFIDMKVLPVKRRLTPIVVSGGEIIWVAGLRRAATAPIGAGTKRTLALRLRLATR